MPTRVTFRRTLAATAAILACCLIPSCAVATVVETTDGRTITGTARVEKGSLVIQSAASAETRLGSDGIRRIVFEPPSQKPTAKPATPQKSPSTQPIEGLKGEYFADTQLKDLKLVRIDPKIQGYWWEGPPDPALPRPFSARWTGRIEPAYSETYSFSCDTNEAARLWIDGKLVLDRWQGPPGGVTGRIPLLAGHQYDLKLEFRSHPRGGNLLLAWSSPHQGWEIIPPKRLLPPPGMNPPTVRILSPANGTMALAAAGVPIEVEASDPDGTIARVELLADHKLISALSQPPWRFQWKHAPPGCHRVTAKATDNSGLSSNSEPLALAVAGSGDGSLPSPWGLLPIGQAGDSRASLADGTFTLSGVGDFWGELSGYHCVGQAITGDAVITAHLRQLRSDPESAALAGLVIRENAWEKHAREAVLAFAGESGIVFTRCEQPWEARATTDEKGDAPCWLKLSRSDRRIRAYRSEDGIHWIMVGERRIDFGQSIVVGLMVASTGEVPAVAAFDHVTISNGSGPAMAATRGILLRSGSLIAGGVSEFTDTSVRMWRKGGEVVIPTAHVACIVYQPITAESAQQLKPGRTGALLNNGDFFEGKVAAIKDGYVQINSVLFGSRRFNMWGAITAAVLHDLAPAAGPCEILAADGSIIHGKRFEFDKDRLIVTEMCDAKIPLQLPELLELRASSRQ